MAALTVKQNNMPPQQQFKSPLQPQLSKSKKIVIIFNLITVIVLLLYIVISIWFYEIKGILILVDPRDQLLSFVLGCRHKTLKYTPQQRGNFWLLHNYYIGEATENAGCASYVTYVVPGSVNDGRFFENLPELVKSWQAPISAGLYASGEHFNETLDAIQYARNCIPEAELVRRFVSFHLFFPAHVNQMPASMPRTTQAATSWDYDCHALHNASQTMKMQQRHWPGKPYPVNVALNMARRAVNTHFILLSPDAAYVPHDVEGQSVSKKFLSLQLDDFCPNIKEHSDCKTGEEARMLATRRLLYVLFKLDMDVLVAPNNRIKLKKLVEQGSAAWKQSPKVTVFISDNYVPWFDERLPLKQELWHGSVQPYAMCLLDYKTTLLTDMFLTFRKNRNKHENALELVNTSDDMSPYLNASTVKTEYLALFGNSNEIQCRFGNDF